MRCLVARLTPCTFEVCATPVAGDSYMDGYIFVLRIVCDSYKFHDYSIEALGDNRGRV